MRTLLSSSLLITTLGLAACGPGESPTQEVGNSSTRPVIYAVNYPLAWAAEQLAGQYADVHFPAPGDVDPAYWEPDLDTIAAYQQADLVILNGFGYAKWLERVSLPRNRLVDSSRELDDQRIEVRSGPVHSHGPEGEHSHGEVAFTTWLDLALYQRQVDTVAGALAARFPDHAEETTARLADISAQFQELDDRLERLGEKLQGTAVLYSHPVYQYFNRRYGVDGRALHWEPDQVPTARDWAELDAVLEEHFATLMIWEDEPMPETRVGLADREIQVVVFRPMGNRPAQGDFASGMALNVAALIEALREGD